MKKTIFFILTFALLGIAAKAQNQQDTSIIPCYGDVQRAILTTETAMFFNLSGINLNKYNWKNPTLNCHVNSAIDHSRRYLNNKTLGYTSTTLGLSGAGTGILLNNISGGGTGLIVIGGIAIMGGIYLLNKAFEHKKSMEQHIHVIGDYYQKNNLY